MQATLRDGAEIAIRPIASEDKRLLASAFERLSPESRYRRFFSPVSRLTEAQLAYFTEVDHRDHEALLALSPGGELVGVARYIRGAERPDAAEVAVTVADDWQGRGVAGELLRRLVVRARAEGIERFTATALSWNRDVIELFGRLGETRVKPPEAGITTLEIELPPTASGQGLRRALRAAATGELSFAAPEARRRDEG